MQTSRSTPYHFTDDPSREEINPARATTFISPGPLSLDCLLLAACRAGLPILYKIQHRVIDERQWYRLLGPDRGALDQTFPFQTPEEL